MPHPYGTAFTRADAEPLISKRTQIANRTRQKIVSALTGHPDEDIKYYNNNVNAFVFSRTELDRLFSNWHEFDALVILMAAKEVSGDMRPTVVIAACKATDNGSGIDLTIPASINKPASETPPKFTDINLPLTDNDDFFVLRLNDL